MSGRQVRKIFVLFMVFMMAIVAAGCGGNAATSQPAPAAGDASQASSAKPEDVRTVKHAMGETEIKGTPQRVVVLTNEGTEALLAMGVKPVGAVRSWSGDPWYDHIKAEMEGVVDLGEEPEPNLEEIASLQPDLILGNKVRQEKVYEQLKAIAPTVFSEELSGKWKQNFALYAEALNKKAEGDKIMADFDQRVAEAKEKLGEKTKTKVSVVRFSAKQVRLYQKDTFSGVLLSQLGFARPASQDKDQFMEAITKERMKDIDGDVLFYFNSNTAGDTDASKVQQEWMKDPLYQTLQVAKENKAHEVNEVIWNTAGGIKAANLLLDEILQYFEVK